MGETTREIEAQIDRTRENLASNIRELDQKVRSAADWKEHFNAHPAIALGVAFGGGILLGHLVSKLEGSSGDQMTHVMSTSTPRPRSLHQAQAMETWDHIKGALLGIAAARITAAVDDVIPGFLEQFNQVQSQSRSRTH